MSIHRKTFHVDDLVKIGKAPRCPCGHYMAALHLDGLPLGLWRCTSETCNTTLSTN